MRNFLPLFLIIPVACFATGGTMAGIGTRTNPWQVADYEDLKMVGEPPYTMDGHYRLVADIDASASKTEVFPGIEASSASGFKPIGQKLVVKSDSSVVVDTIASSVGFSGMFNGAGHVISNLHIVNFAAPSTGFFFKIDSLVNLDSLTLKNYYFKGIYSGGIAGVNYGTIKDVHIEADTLDFVHAAGGIVSENYGAIVNSSFSGMILGGYLGGIAYDNSGIISNCEAVLKNGSSEREAAMFGGISYNNTGTIRNSKTSGTIRGSTNIGGIASINYGTVERCSSSVDIYGAGGSDNFGINVKSVAALGGLVAVDSGKIHNSHASGNVTATASNAGGLVGITFGEVIGCTASGEVKTLAYSGSFVGTNRGKIDSSSATGKIVGSAYLGGFAGQNLGEIRNSYATGSVDATASTAGGFVAKNDTSGIIEKSYSTGNVNCYVNSGGFAGENWGKISQAHSIGHVQGATSIGGFIGKQEGGSTEQSYSTGLVLGEISVGGFAGSVKNSSIDQCYSTGDVLEGHVQVSGFVPLVLNSSVTNSFSTGNVYSADDAFENAGSFVAVADSASTIKNSFSMGAVSNSTLHVDKVCATMMVDVVEGYYWNISNCTVVDSANYGIGLTSEQMKSSESFDKFDFDKLWAFESGASFPTLKNVAFDTTMKDSAGFFGSEIERYVPPSEKDPGKVDIKQAPVTMARLAVSFSCRYTHGSVEMKFTLPRTGKVDVRIFDFQGREVGAVLGREFASGRGDMRWEASGLSKGRYLAVLRVDGKIVAKSGFVKVR